MLKHPLTFLCVALMPLIRSLSGCGESRHDAHESSAAQSAPEPTVAAVAVIAPIAGHTGTGVIHFTEVPTGMHIVASFSGFHPGQHGFHIHEYGDLSNDDLSALGGHFNPSGQPHGGPDSAQHHAGDLGNLIIGDDGQGHVDEVVAGLSFRGPTCIIGRSVVIHENQDDFTAQPAGNSGTRIAAAVIGLSKP